MNVMAATKPQGDPVSVPTKECQFHIGVLQAWNAGIGYTVTQVERGERWGSRLARLLFRVLFGMR